MPVASCSCTESCGRVSIRASQVSRCNTTTTVRFTIELYISTRLSIHKHRQVATSSPTVASFLGSRQAPRSLVMRPAVTEMRSRVRRENDSVLTEIVLSFSSWIAPFQIRSIPGGGCYYWYNSTQSWATAASWCPSVDSRLWQNQEVH